MGFYRNFVPSKSTTITLGTVVVFLRKTQPNAEKPNLTREIASHVAHSHSGRAQDRGQKSRSDAVFYEASTAGSPSSCELKRPDEMVLL
jgi:hypothetical protein